MRLQHDLGPICFSYYKIRVRTEEWRETVQYKLWKEDHECLSLSGLYHTNPRDIYKQNYRFKKP